MVGAGLLIILNFLCFGALFILFYRFREISRTQNILGDRIGVIEEMMLELTRDDPDYEETAPVLLEEDERLKELSVEPVFIPVEEERTRKILDLSQQGLSAEMVARESGYSIGEVRLVLNLHRRHP